MIHEQNTIINKELVTEECLHHHQPKLCWSALFGGAFVGVGLGFLLHLFGMAIGLSAYSAAPNGATMITIGGLLGLLIGVIASMGAAGFVSGYLGRFFHCHCHCHCHGGIIYGFITWSLALALSALLVIPLGHYMAFYKDSLHPSMTMSNQAPNVTAKTEPEKAVATNVANKTVGPVSSTDLAWGGWVMFLLFFIGALASCIGACAAMLCRQKLHTHHHPEIPPRDVRTKL